MNNYKLIRLEKKINRARIARDYLGYQINHLEDQYEEHKEKSEEINATGHAWNLFLNRYQTSIGKRKKQKTERTSMW